LRAIGIEALINELRHVSVFGRRRRRAGWADHAIAV
jgi:hypothetical protein